MRTGWFDDENYFSLPPLGKPGMILVIILGLTWLAYKLLGG